VKDRRRRGRKEAQKEIGSEDNYIHKNILQMLMFSQAYLSMYTNTQENSIWKRSEKCIQQ
jgi:hypothetical protein